MKKIYIVLFVLGIMPSLFSQVNFCDDFESYAVGDPIAQTSPNWNSWDELMNGTTAPFADDVNVDGSQSYSGSNSLYLVGNPGPGPQDIVLMFDNTPNITNTTLSSLSTPHIVGDLVFSQMMYVRSGAYLNFQAENMPGTQWAMEMNFDATGDLVMSNTNNPNLLTSGYPLMQWFELKFEIDLSNNMWELFIDGVSQGSFSNSFNQISSLDVYTRAGDEFWIDDVCYSYTPATLFATNGQMANVSDISGLTGQERYASVEIRNFGTNLITSCDVTFDYNGIQMTENLTNINGGFGIASLASMQVDFPNPITLIAGTNIATVTISNVNGLAQDDNPGDDIMTTQITAITPTANKLVIGEEATGTWCGWCPRGAVAINEMERDYAGYFQAIAVHNGNQDPMVNADYDAALYSFHGGSFPSAVVDRVVVSPAIDPSDFEQYFMQKIVDPISATITNGASASGSTLDVSLTVDVLSSGVNSSWSLACVLVEDSVTGSGGNWYQSNSYGANGISLIDVDGTDWGTLPNWVPDIDMIYRHVGRSIAPSFDGDPLDNSYNSGEQFTKCFQFTLDPSWDVSQMHIVGMLLNSNGEVDNASSTYVASALDNGYSACSPTSIESSLLSLDDKVSVYPNPFNSLVKLAINLDVENDVSVSIKSVEGKTIAHRDYGIMNGRHSLTMDLSNFSKGLYIIETIVGQEVIIDKLVKE